MRVGELGVRVEYRVLERRFGGGTSEGSGG